MAEDRRRDCRGTRTPRRCDRAPATNRGCANCARDAQEIRQVELADPEHVDAGHRGNRLDVRETLVGLDLRDDHRALVQRGDLRGEIAALVVVVRETERRAAPARRRIARARDDVRASSAVPTIGTITPNAPTSSARAMNVIVAARHAHQRDDVEPAAQRDLRLQRLEAQARCAPCRRARIRRPRCGDLRQPGERNSNTIAPNAVPPAASFRLTGLCRNAPPCDERPRGDDSRIVCDARSISSSARR